VTGKLLVSSPRAVRLRRITLGVVPHDRSLQSTPIDQYLHIRDWYRCCTEEMATTRRDEEPLLSTSTSRIVTFGKADPGDPRNWSRARKWLMVGAILPIDLSVSWGASGFSPAAGDFANDVGVSPQIATLGLSLYVLGLAFGPMSLAPLSEYYGRRPVYIISYGMFLLLLLATSYVESLAPFLILRLFSGFFSSTTISNFGGTIADLFHHNETGPAMSWFADGLRPLFVHRARPRLARSVPHNVFHLLRILAHISSCAVLSWRDQTQRDPSPKGKGNASSNRRRTDRGPG
jgi:hypothetical protein